MKTKKYLVKLTYEIEVEAEDEESAEAQADEILTGPEAYTDCEVELAEDEEDEEEEEEEEEAA